MRTQLNSWRTAIYGGFSKRRAVASQCDMLFTNLKMAVEDKVPAPSRDEGGRKLSRLTADQAAPFTAPLAFPGD